jgi:hypothetical protein
MDDDPSFKPDPNKFLKDQEVLCSLWSMLENFCCIQDHHVFLLHALPQFRKAHYEIMPGLNIVGSADHDMRHTDANIPISRAKRTSSASIKRQTQVARV